jgi:thiamine biosynthesis lipoprotein
MGSDLHVIVWARGPAAERLADLAALRVELLERCWSRFRPGSELNRLNARAGCGATAVSDDLRRLVTALVDAYTWSDGDVDASVLGAMLTLGYREDFALIAMSLPRNATPAPTAAPGLGGVRLEEGAVGLPAGVGLDPGGVGKGLAGDMVTEEIHDAGAHAVLVGIGGDVVTRGIPPDVGSWRVAMRDDRFDETTERRVLDLTPRHRAVATSSILRRRWAGGHHLLQPHTGRPAHSGIVQATVLADCGWRAEAAATVGVIRGASSADWLIDRGCMPYLLGAGDG